MSQQGQSLCYSEFRELVRLAEVEPLSDLDSRLKPLLAQPLAWYQGLVRVLLTKYADHNRQFTSPDGTTQHIVVLHPRYLDAFVMLSVDTHAARGVCWKTIIPSSAMGSHLLLCCPLINIIATL